MNEKKQKGFRITYLIVAVIVALLVALLFVDFGDNGKNLDTSDGWALTAPSGYTDADGNLHKAEYVVLKDGKVYVIEVGSRFRKEQAPRYSDFYFTYPSLEDAIEKLDAAGIAYDYQRPGINIWDIIVPVAYIGFGLFMFFMLFKMIGSANKGAMNFGKTQVKSYNMSKARFSDIAGMDEEKAELQEIVEFLKNPKKFTDLGARIPKGVLLVGRPGTGKTLLARAVAGESKVPFISISGSDFVEMFVGVGASRVRDLFEQAKKNKPCIVFIDEIDAVGRQRGAGLGGGNDEREQTLNQLLVEMDGFESNEGIIIMAATNRSDVLDPALMRPGRFDRQIYVHAPDVKGREGILKIHARNKPIDENVDFNVLARITTGFTGADIENMLNEAAIMAARAGRTTIIMEDITEGINKVVMGSQKKSSYVTEKDKKITAYHEAGHTLIAKSLKHCDDVQEVSIIPRGSAGGYTYSRPEHDESYISVNRANDEIAMSMGGRIAEEIIFKDFTSGASSDMQHATKLAHSMVYDWGMSKKIGFLSLGSQSQVFIGRDYQTKNEFSEKLAAVADDEIMSILNSNYKRAKEIMTEKVDILHEMAKVLLARETIYKEEVDMIMAGKKAEEVVAAAEKKEKDQKEKENKIKEEKLKNEKLASYERKIAEGEKLVSLGIITQKELDAVKKERDEYVNSLLEKNPEEESAEKKVEADEKPKVTKPRTRKPAVKKEDKNEGDK